ncbi:hypothetical protein [Flavobacterium capsici]|uniref:Uncharacterized protein n=1 Tax=Flavobacterium capsici TaxID=3075618 RepID=A0AA96EUQ9_9FLAO|nr:MULTISPECIES: hypothetical protein [unclassified Flavobacterium]WNM18142.1 hypothetical protein RN608_08960 [Flavobacterium sp. PMR2A8]WNM22194.1 hypothetical protein RN605_02260 [Flavobacterium sp. PMTSA4]
MKKFALPFIIVAIIIGIYEYSKVKPNMYVVIVVIVLFMFGMFQLNSKIPSKFSDEEENDTEEND